MDKINIKYFFCDSFVFCKGEWLGTFPFEFESKNASQKGFLYVAYKQFSKPSLYNRIAYDKKTLSSEKELFPIVTATLEPILLEEMEKLKEIFIEPREIHMPRPRISSFHFHEKLSDDNKWHFSMKVICPHGAEINSYNEPFELTMERVDGKWNYSFTPSKGSLPSFKNTMKWEDYLMEEAVRHIHDTPQIRLKFLYDKLRFKYK